MARIHANLTDAHTAFSASIVAANRQKPDPDVLNDVYQEKLDRLDQAMHVLETLAFEGMEEQIPPLLNTLLQEWAIKEAAELLLRSPNRVIDPTSEDVRDAFWRKLDRQHQMVVSELLLKIQQGKDRRAQADAERAQSWQSVAVHAIENQQNQQQQWQNAASQWVQGQQQLNLQWFQHHQQMFNHYQQANQQWANAAMVGVQQAQLGLKQWYDFAAASQQHVTNMLAGTEQRQAVMVEQAVRRENARKWATRLTIIGLILLGVVALGACSFVAMMNLY